MTRAFLRTPLLAPALLLFAVATPGSAQSAPPASHAAEVPAATHGTGEMLDGLLRPGPMELEMHILGPPAHMVELTARVQEAADADPAWWAAHLELSAPEDPLLYDERMGVTPEEFELLLALPDSVRMRPIGTARIEVEETAYGWRILPEAEIALLAGVEIDTIAAVVRTPIGELGPEDPVVASPDQVATGAWNGPLWSILEVDDGMMIRGDLSIGAHESGRTLIYFDASVIRENQPVLDQTLFLLSIP